MTTEASRRFYALNQNALIGNESDGTVAMIEDVTDTDMRVYRMEYRSTPDGDHANAFCLYDPWGFAQAGRYSGGGHLGADGMLCIARDVSGHTPGSPYDIEFVVERARYWCTAFSVFNETGAFPNP